MVSTTAQRLNTIQLCTNSEAVQSVTLMVTRTRIGDALDLSDKVRMWMLLNMIAQKTGNLSEM